MSAEKTNDSFEIKDKRRNSPDFKEEPKEVCRVCGSSDVHSQEYSKPKMACIEYLRVAHSAKVRELQKRLESAEHYDNLLALEHERKRADALEAKVRELEEQLANAKKCSFCGGTDTVCYKGHVESTNELKAQLSTLQSKCKGMEEALEKIIGLHYPTEAPMIQHDMFRIAAYALKSFREEGK